MTRTAFNDGWSVKTKTDLWAQLTPSGEPALPVTLPHDMLIGQGRSAEASGRTAYFPQSSEYEYVRVLDVPDHWRDRRVSLEFQGAYRHAMVFVNGVRAGYWANGYSTMVVEVDDLLRYGAPNEIKVEVRAHDDSRWYSGVGLIRDVVLVVTDLVFLDHGGIFLTTPDVDDDLAVIEIEAPIRSARLHPTTLSVDAEVYDSDGSCVARGRSLVTVAGGDAVDSRQRLYLPNPRRWSPDQPNLYRVEISAKIGTEIVDTAEFALGVRTLQLDPLRGLRINGQTIKLRGACIHHDNGFLGGAAIARAEERRIELLKAAGFNAIRSSHNPISQPMLEACDRLGMLVMDESFDMWTETKTSFDYALVFEDWWERDLEAMVRKDRNHPSVILYSIGNEIPDTGNPTGAAWSRRLAAKIRELDGTRYVTNGINGFVSVISDMAAAMKHHAETQASTADPSTSGGVNAAGDLMSRVAASEMVSVRIEEALATLDIAGFNYAEGRYENDGIAYPNRIIVGTETFPKLIAKNWSLVEALPHVIGDFTWTGWDYLGEVGIGRLHYSDDDSHSLESPYPWITAWCGDIDLTGHRRPQSYYREIVFGLTAQPYIAVDRADSLHRKVLPGSSQWSWTDSISSWTWDVEPGTPLPLEVYSNAEEVELLLNGRTVARERVGTAEPFRARFVVPFASGELVAVAYRDGNEVGRASLSTAQGEATLHAESDRSQIRSSSDDLAFVDIEIQDRSGTVFTNRDRLVGVEVEGPAVLQGLGSGRPDTAESYAASVCTTFDGRAQAVIRPTGPGVITVRVVSDGMRPVSIEISAAESAIIRS